MKKIFIILIVLLGLTSLNMVWAQAIEEGEVLPEPVTISEVMVETDTITNADFETARETFLNNQTTANRKAFDEAGVNWAKQLLSDQLAFVNEQEVFWYGELRDKEGVESNWLEAERAAIEVMQTDLESATTYAQAKNVILAGVDNWQNVIKKIRQMRVRRAYDNLALLVLQAEAIKAELTSEQLRLAGTTPDLPENFWQDWQLVFDTYTVELDKTKNLLSTNRGELQTPEAIHIIL